MDVTRLHLDYINEQLGPDGMPQKVTYNIPENFNFAYDVVDLIARLSPNRRAMLWVSPNGEASEYSFEWFSNESNRVASMLLKQGVKKGDRVLLVLKRHLEFWPSILACHKIGAVAIPATNQLSPEDLVYRFKASDISAAICTVEDHFPSNIDKAEKMSGRSLVKFSVHGEWPGWNEYKYSKEHAIPFLRPTGKAATTNGDIMLIYFTSGTSGMPKMVVHDFTYPIGHISTAKYWQKVDPEGLHMTVSETGWAKSVWGKLYGQWFLAAGIFVYDYRKFDTHNMLSAFSKYGITTFCAPPTMYRFFIKEDLSKYDFKTLKHVTIAGEALNPEVFEQFKKGTGLSLYEGYGQTETTLTVFNSYWSDPRPGSMGRPSPAYDIDILDDNGESAPAGVTGEIVLRVPTQPHPEVSALAGLYQGYFRDEELTASVWHDNVYRTGDTAWHDEDGYYWYVGRSDDIIKSSGYRIGPFEVESVIMEHPAVLECAVTPLPDPIRGQIVKATIVLTRGHEPSEELTLDIQSYVKSHTAPYKYPRVIEFVSELPKTISGKIRRTEIRASEENK